MTPENDCGRFCTGGADGLILYLAQIRIHILTGQLDLKSVHAKNQLEDTAGYSSVDRQVGQYRTILENRQVHPRPLCWEASRITTQIWDLL